MKIVKGSKETIKLAEVGVIIGRFQIHKLHIGHQQLINFVSNRHKKLIIFLGVSRGPISRKNPFDFATRKAMIQATYPNAIILPLTDIRYNEAWSKKLDEIIPSVFGERKTVIYGSRDSFIPFYSGKYEVIELETDTVMGATSFRLDAAKEVINSEDFRKGIIYSTFNHRSRIDSCVDVCAFNKDGEILMAKKPNEPLWRFIGGYVDQADDCDETAAKREFKEETGGGCCVGKMQYICSGKINDWRYKDRESSIMSRLFLCDYTMGFAKASDDIEEVKWIHISEFSNFNGIRTKVMIEHRDFMTKLVDKVYAENLIENIGERKEEVYNVDYIIE